MKELLEWIIVNNASLIQDEDGLTLSMTLGPNKYSAKIDPSREQFPDCDIVGIEIRKALIALDHRRMDTDGITAALAAKWLRNRYGRAWTYPV